MPLVKDLRSRIGGLGFRVGGLGPGSGRLCAQTISHIRVALPLRCPDDSGCGPVTVSEKKGIPRSLEYPYLFMVLRMEKDSKKRKKRWCP